MENSETTVLLTEGFFKKCEKSLLPYLQYRNINKDIRTWVLDIFQGNTGFFWGIQIFIPIIGRIYQVPVQKQIVRNDDWIASFDIFDCHGTIVSQNELPSQINVTITAIQGLQCYAEIASSNSGLSHESEKVERIFYSSHGTTILLDNFFDTGMLLAQDAWANEKMPIHYLLHMPTDNFLHSDSFPVVPRILSKDAWSFCMLCDNCNGNGKITCEKCDGNGYIKCKKCQGTGYIECKNCNGTGGRWTCSKCGGSGQLSCDHCYGTGKITCKKCGGSGDHYSARGNRYDCSACNGTGRWECRACRGHGSIECFVCKGKGSGHCHVCDGQGQLQCNSCNGSGSVTCSRCEGTGNIDCWVCQGTGRIFVHPDFRNKQFLRKHNEEETVIPATKVFLFDSQSQKVILLNGFWAALKKGVFHRICG